MTALTITSSMLLDKPIVIASHCSAVQPAKLVWLNWLPNTDMGADAWQAGIDIARLQKHLSITDIDIQFVQENSLSKDTVTENLLRNCIEQLQQYTQHQRRSFDIELDLSIGTSFQQKVWHALQQIPYGTTISYAKLASNIGQPSAYRAVANANGKNPISVIVPCHRVIASDGGLGGYTGGIDKKIALLKVEQVQA